MILPGQQKAPPKRGVESDGKRLIRANILSGVGGCRSDRNDKISGSYGSRCGVRGRPDTSTAYNLQVCDSPVVVNLECVSVEVAPGSIGDAYVDNYASEGGRGHGQKCGGRCTC